MWVVGVDPGKTGAIALWSPDSRELVIEDMPESLEVLASKLVDISKFANIAYIERVGGVGKQSASRSFNFGFTTGAVHGALATLGFRIHTVSPMKWKASYGLKRQLGELDRDFKGRSRALAGELLPEFRAHFKRAKDDGRAEAALIAYYGAAIIRAQVTTGR